MLHEKPYSTRELINGLVFVCQIAVLPNLMQGGFIIEYIENCSEIFKIYQRTI